MRSLAIAAAFVTVAVAAPPVALAQSGSLSGSWSGGYISSDGADVNTFNVTLNQNARSLTGSIVETNTFGDLSTALFLTSNLSGSINGRTVQFVKTYDGAGGVSHSISYTGTLVSSRRIRGTFDAGGGVGGTFEMVR